MDISRKLEKHVLEEGRPTEFWTAGSVPRPLPPAATPMDQGHGFFSFGVILRCVLFLAGSNSLLTLFQQAVNTASDQQVIIHCLVLPLLPMML